MRVRTLLKHQLRRLGLEVSRFNRPDSFAARRQRLLSRLDINLVLDAGANDGGFGLELRGAGYEGRIISFEPLPGPFASLENRLRRDARWDALPWGLGDVRTEAVMHVTRDDKCSSVLRPLDRQTHAYAGSIPTGSTRVRIEALDGVYADLVGEADRPFLKIDTQGYEMHVLRGADRSLGTLMGLQIELSLVPLYEGSSSYIELLTCMQERCFVPVAIEPVFSDPATDQLLQVDALFERSPRS